MFSRLPERYKLMKMVQWKHTKLCCHTRILIFLNSFSSCKHRIPGCSFFSQMISHFHLLRPSNDRCNAQQKGDAGVGWFKEIFGSLGRTSSFPQQSYKYQVRVTNELWTAYLAARKPQMFKPLNVCFDTYVWHQQSADLGWCRICREP